MSFAQRVIIGQINGLYGIRGWVKVFSYTSPITNILNYSSWLLYQQGQWQTMTVSEGQTHSKGIIVRLDTIHNRDDAARLLGADIAIDRKQLPTPSIDEYYWMDLIGLTVINCEGITLGQIDHLLETGANDVLVLKGERECLIPFLRDHILEVDLTRRVIRVDWDAEY